MDIKNELFEYLWNDFKSIDLEKWICNQDSILIDKLFKNDIYLDIIMEDFSRMSTDKTKRYIFDKFNQETKVEWDKFVAKKHIPLVGICKENCSLHYSEPINRNWDLIVGKKYEIIEIVNKFSEHNNHDQYVRYVNRDFDLNPSGYVPKDLFEIDLSNISDIYLIEQTNLGTIISPKDWSDKFYKPRSNYSFWEDFYNDDKGAIEIYNRTLDQLGIKNVW